MESGSTVTEILKDARSGDREALDRLFPLLYTELRVMANRQLRGTPADGTLRTTALINEAYLRMVDQEKVDLVDRSHFFAYASRVMRSALVDHARKMGAGKRGGGAVRLSLEDRDVPVDMQADFLLSLDEALTRLAAVAERACRVVECRYFGGLTERETADALGVTDRTVRRDWLKAKAYLYEALA
ncbi:MAG: sigma-70 family RNA polymerase sigma factor [Candidatus Palauibacterales bacterium]|nr:sigma-70 family RNA polymerase sigma factor [Candidatus Palauibacterales bacterium]